MIERDENGKFAKGNVGGPGRPKRDREVEYYRILQSQCTTKDWVKIVQKAIDQASRGDAVARKWLADYLIGEPDRNMNIDTIITWLDGEN